MLMADAATWVGLDTGILWDVVLGFCLCSWLNLAGEEPANGCTHVHAQAAELQLYPCYFQPLMSVVDSSLVHQAATVTAFPSCPNSAIYLLSRQSALPFDSLLSIFASLCISCHPALSMSQEDSPAYAELPGFLHSEWL